MQGKGSKSNYVKATTIKQVSRTTPSSQAADVWLGGTHQTDDDGNVFVTLEIQPAWGNIAAIRLSLDELRDLGAMIVDRLGAIDFDVALSVGPAVQLSVPANTHVEISYT